MHEIEGQVDLDASLRCIKALESLGAEFIGDVVLWDGRHYQLLWELENRRTLHIRFAPIDQTKEQLGEISGEINGFGKIYSCTITGPTHKLPEIQTALNAVVEQFRAAYIALEDAYLNSHSIWLSELFTRVYAVLNSELKVHGREVLCDRFWISISSLSQVQFRYHFSADNLRNASDWFRTRQHALVSPCEALTLLISEDAPDAILAPSQPRVSSLSFDPLTHVIEFDHLPSLGSQTSFWLAERELFGSHSLGATNIANIEGMAFEVNYPAEVVAEIQPVIDGARDDLKHIIELLLADFRGQQKRLQEALQRSRDFTSAVRDFASDVIAKYLAEKT